jgi:hypothetical protein
MDKMAGTLDLLWNITYVIRFISPKLEETELWKQLIFFREKSLYYFLHPKIWPLKPQWISLTLSYILNLQAHFVRSDTHRQLL